MARSAEELIVGRDLGIMYRSMAFDCERQAALTRLAGRTLEAGKQRNWARIAKRAAMAEELHPDSPEPDACSICGRVRSCLAVS